MRPCGAVRVACGAIGLLLCPACLSSIAAAEVDLAGAVVVTRSGDRGPAESMAATILAEELEKRTGSRLRIHESWPTDARAVIALGVRDAPSSWRGQVPQCGKAGMPEAKAEGFTLTVMPPGGGAPARAFVIGTDGRGVMYGVGRLLRLLRCGAGTLKADAPIDIAETPEYRIRGHQLGYRARANSYDAWTPERYEQYIRELIVFGVNCIENIPFEDAQKSPLMPVPREVMNRRLSEVCAKYDIDYWVWTPVDFSLADESLRGEAIEQHEAFYRSCVRLDAVFFPGGDPGDNPPELVIPFLKDLAGRLAKHHPRAKMWVSLQGFSREKALRFLEFVEKEAPSWLGGLVAGPSSPPICETRLRLPKQYGLRWYPDITHTVRCQYPVDWWDPAFALTLGREPPNPRPSDYATIFGLYAPHTDGFLTYSDGIDDDVNKAVLSMLGWNSRRDGREMLVEYSRFFFGADVAEAAADGLLGLEANWRGSLAPNAGVDGVLALWQRMEETHAELLGNWRFQMHLLRAYYDAYTRYRLIHETRLEREAMVRLALARDLGPGVAMDQALEVLGRADSGAFRPEWRRRILELADALFKSIGYQTSVRRYHASGTERGCIIDFLDHPLNERWWLEDEFAKVRKMASDSEKLARLEVIRVWAEPGPGSFYDDVGNVGNSPRVMRGEAANTDPEHERHDGASHAWWEEGMSRKRLSWQHYMRWPLGVAYEGLDPAVQYVVRVTGQGESLVRADGVRLVPTRYSKEIGEFKEFPVPPELTRDGRLRLTWDDVNESHLNWRRQSHVAEVWLLRQ